MNADRPGPWPPAAALRPAKSHGMDERQVAVVDIRR